MKGGGRHVTLMKTFPMVVLNDKHAYTLNGDDDE